MSSIRAHGVPAADKAKTSDPYAHVTLLNGRAGMTEMARTQPVWNTLEPSWPHALQLMLAAGTDAAMDCAPRLRVRVYDKDLTDADDLLGESEVVLSDLEGTCERLVLKGAGGFADCAISFAYTISAGVSPAATLKLSALRAAGMPKAKKGAKKGKGSADPYIRFHVLEADDMSGRAPTVATPSIANAAEHCDWGTLELSLPLPRGSARPPLLAIGVWDDDVTTNDDALAFEDVRLSEGGGEHSVKLVGRKGSGCKHVTVHFVAAVVT